ncbi:hypothetical protein KEU06_07045 [Pseudaminobacter sp. 19-2017]|uniref:Uncharacterized protein n=1 Tax=Pseudaminobacter soli (ex Zhang et al. 2022) TaxID=2831468 RepID=A0A942DVT2_9HYPH|nr:hypothetical protein [Pseudaminobacter soli]MBS3648384.1 hypothetical protein [Pseudaminobacter soli]
MGSRLEEVEHAVDQNGSEIKASQIEIVGLQNEILNALQSGLMSIAEIQEFRGRLEALERRIGQ